MISENGEDVWDFAPSLSRFTNLHTIQLKAVDPDSRDWEQALDFILDSWAPAKDDQHLVLKLVRVGGGSREWWLRSMRWVCGVVKERYYGMHDCSFYQ